MTKLATASQFKDFLAEPEKIVVVQADNPDIDSLASSLALEDILEKLGKKVVLYCGVDLPGYLHYLPGWSRVVSELPKQFDASIIVDTSSASLLEQLERSGAKSWLASRPAAIIDHHSTEASISFASVVVNYPAVATAEVIYELSTELGWKLDLPTRQLLAMGILSDSLGLMSSSTTARSIHIIAELVEQGVDLAQLESLRRESLRRDPELIHYKGELLRRVEFHDNNRIASVTIPWAEIEKYSPSYNPSMLVIDDMRLARDTDVAVAFKLYKDGKITAKIRCNYGFAIADKLAEHFGGGGHPLASGFKLTDGRSLDEVKAEMIKVASTLIDEAESKLAK